MYNYNLPHDLLWESLFFTRSPEWCFWNVNQSTSSSKRLSVTPRIKSKPFQWPYKLQDSCYLLIVSFSLLSIFKFTHSPAWTAIIPGCLHGLFFHVLGPWPLYTTTSTLISVISYFPWFFLLSSFQKLTLNILHIYLDLVFLFGFIFSIPY